MSFEHSEKLENLPKALVAMQAKMPSPKKQGVNSHFARGGTGGKYLKLDDIVLAVQPILAAHGFAITQTFEHLPDAGGVVVVTTLLHESGEWVSSTLPMPVAKQNDPQAVGSAITYARRYSLASILGIVSDEDDDGNKGAEQPRARVEPKASIDTLKTIARIGKSLYGDSFKAKSQAKLKALGRESSLDVTPEEADTWLAQWKQEQIDANRDDDTPTTMFNDNNNPAMTRD